MNEYRVKITENGRIIIPALLRKAMHITAGEELVVRFDNDELRIFSLKHSLKKAQKIVHQYAKNKSLVQKLKVMRNEDSQND